MRAYTLKHRCWSWNGTGRRLAWATAVSVVVVLIAPVVVSMCILSTLSRSFPCPFHPALFPNLAVISAPQTSTAYSISGTTTQLYSLRMRRGLIPREGLASRRQARVYFDPLEAAAAICSLNHSCLSMMTPKNLCDATGLTVFPAITIGIHLVGTIFRGLSGAFCLRLDA